MASKKKPIKTFDSLVCNSCGKNKKTILFYVSNSVFHAGTGHLPYCKECLKDMCVNERNKIEIEKFHSVLKEIDRPYIHDLATNSFDQARSSELYEGDDRDFVGIYFKNINSLKQYRNLTWKNSIFPEDEEPNHSIIDESFELTPKILKFWGKMDKYDLWHYEFLENKYHEYTAAYECETPVMEELLKQASFESLTIQVLRSAGEDASKNLKTLQEILTSANIKPAQESGANASDQLSFGLLIKKYENERPIPEPEEEWKDVDGIGKYIRVWFLGHLCKIMDLKNDYSEEYEREMANLRVEVSNVPIEADEMEAD